MKIDLKADAPYSCIEEDSSGNYTAYYDWVAPKSSTVHSNHSHVNFEEGLRFIRKHRYIMLHYT